MIAIAVFLVSLFWTNDEKIVKTEFLSLAEYRGPIDDCLNINLLYSHEKNILSECTKNYLHFFPSQELRNRNNPARPNDQISLGSFNMFHLGDNLSSLKNFSLVAEIVYQCDVVAAQEFMPLPNDDANLNTKIADHIKRLGPAAKIPFEPWSVRTPGYLSVLIELQKLDSSWSLIMQASPAGEGSTGEMAGYFYRSARVQLAEWKYCPAENNINLNTNVVGKSLGCVVQIPKAQQKLISRTAFAAHFISSDFTFVALTSHIRYRPVDTVPELKAQQKTLCSLYVDPKNCKFAKEDVGRYYEVYTVSEQIKSIQQKSKIKNVIFMGDFNLEINPATNEFWRAALKHSVGLMPFQKGLSTLSTKSKKLVSNYDHFLFNPQITKTCDLNSINTMDYTSDKLNDDAVASHVKKYLQPDVQKNWVTDVLQQQQSLLRFENKDGGNLVALNEKDKIDLATAPTAAAERMKENDFAVYLELISDHLPIYMNCKTKL